MENESTPTLEMDNNDSENIEENWLSLPEAEKEAYRTKALAYIAESIRSAAAEGKNYDEQFDATMDRRNTVVFKGTADAELSTEDYSSASDALDSFRKPTKDVMGNIGNFMARVNVEVMAQRMMNRDRKSL